MLIERAFCSARSSSFAKRHRNGSPAAAETLAARMGSIRSPWCNFNCTKIRPESLRTCDNARDTRPHD
jgi:hypothetical protein